MKSVVPELRAVPWDKVFYKVHNKVDSKAWRFGDDLITEVNIIIYWQLRAQVLIQVEEKLR
jgi:hypothetical protein